MNAFTRNALPLALALGCTARGGAGVGPAPVNSDAGSSMTDVVSPPADNPAPADVPPAPPDAPVIDDAAPPSDLPVVDDAVAPPGDVPVTPTCGDGVCGEGETCTACPSDCGSCPARCGDGMCSSGETCTMCPSDCGPCPTTCAATSCGACAESSACGWCRTTSSCLPRAGATCADLVTTPSSCAVTPPLNITSACAVATTNGANDCGFRMAATFSCTPGATLTFGCTGSADAGACSFSGGACLGDPVTRVCAGTTATGCAFAARLMPQNPGLNGVTADDDACGLCPWVRVACPSAGSVTVFSRAYNIAEAASCTLARM